MTESLLPKKAYKNKPGIASLLSTSEMLNY